MPTLSRAHGRLRRLALTAALFAGVLLVVSPASADHKRHRGHHHGARVAVLVGLPPIALRLGPPVAYYGPVYDDRGYDRAYEEGYDDGYDDRAREEWRRRHYRHHHHDDDCDH